MEPVSDPLVYSSLSVDPLEAARTADRCESLATFVRCDLKKAWPIANRDRRWRKLGARRQDQCRDGRHTKNSTRFTQYHTTNFLKITKITKITWAFLETFHHHNATGDGLVSIFGAEPAINVSEGSVIPLAACIVQLRCWSLGDYLRGAVLALGVAV